MTLEKEIKLLKEKVAMLEKIKELEEQINQLRQPVYIPYPYYVNPHPYRPWPYSPITTADPQPCWIWNGDNIIDGITSIT